MKIVYAYHPETGAFAGEVKLNDSDKCQLTGEWLVPGNCLEKSPPAVIESERVVHAYGHWEVRPVLAPVIAPTPAPTREMLIADLENEVERDLEAQARALGYASADRLVSFADEWSVPKYVGEARGFRRMRSLTWAKFFMLIAETDERGEVPTIEAIRAELPTLDHAYIAAETAIAQMSVDAVSAYEVKQLEGETASQEPASNDEAAPSASVVASKKRRKA